MKQILFSLMIFFMLTSCAPAATPLPTATPTIAPPTQPPATETPTPTATVEATATVTPEVLAPITIVNNLELLSQADVVADGQEAEYAKRVLAAYDSGQIENFSNSIVSPITEMINNRDNLMMNRLGQGSIFWPHLEKYDVTNIKARPVREVTLVQDGQGGYRVIQLWKQKDGTPGIVWYHKPKETSVAYGKFEEILSGQLPTVVIVPGEFKDRGSCSNLTGDAASCAVLMTPENVAAIKAALQEWVDTGFIPQVMQNGTIQFPMGSRGF
jgi:hypothetical protein